MKKLVLALLLLSAVCFAAKKPNPADYPINLHVASSHMDVGNAGWVESVTAIIGGKKYELMCSGRISPFEESYMILKPGDYKARLLKDKHPTEYQAIQSYELLFPDNKVMEFNLVGMGD
jgi:hypothetical protein